MKIQLWIEILILVHLKYIYFIHIYWRIYSFDILISAIFIFSTKKLDFTKGKIKLIKKVINITLFNGDLIKYYVLLKLDYTNLA